MANRQQFYVYEHWRLDKDECFYVGKGKGSRAYAKSGRNSHWNNIVGKLERIGSAYEVRIVSSGLTEEEAFQLEKERIAFWRDIVDLANKTDGGDGVSGLVMTAEVRQKMSEKAKGRKGNPTMLGKKHSDATKLKMKLAKVGKKPNNFGKKYQSGPLSDEHKAKLSAAKIGTVPKHETRAKLSEAAKKQWADPLKRPDRRKKAGV
jgi:hypothetical protein